MADMGGMNSVWGSTHLERAEVWSTMLKESMEDDLFGSQYVNWLTEFPDGDTFKISSVGDLVVDEMAESVPLPERRPDTGQFTFQITEFEGVKVPFTDKFVEDDFLANAALAKMPDRMRKALDQSVEGKIFALQSQQVAADLNSINGHAHRWVAGGTAPVTGAIRVEDFARAKLSLQKANNNLTGLVAIVDATTAYILETLTNLVNVSNNPMWDGIVASGITDSTGLRFVRNVYGFDVYTSNYLTTVGAETIDGVVGDGYIANQFFSASDSEMLPYMGAWRRMPKVASWRDEDKETEYYQLSARYGLKLYRPENLITVLSNTDIFA